MTPISNSRNTIFGSFPAREETGLGLWQDKVLKNVFATQLVHESIRHETTVGVVACDEAGGITEIAEPMGPLFVKVPLSSPTATVLFTILIALKSRNPLLISPSSRTMKCCAEAARICYQAALDASDNITARRAGNDIQMDNGRDVWRHSEMEHVEAQCPPEIMDSEDVLFILYTSGSTGKPKGIFHSTAGFLLGAKLTHHYIFDIRDTDIFWCTADIGWITGHSYVVYGPLANGATVFLYEGAPNFPDKDRYWKMIAKYSITVFYTAPTAIRSFMQWGDKWPKKHDLSSLRLLGTVGEPINPQAWIWYYENIGGKRCPIVDTWWQTETGSIMISTFPGAVAAKPGSAGLPLPGVLPEIVDDQGQPLPHHAGGKLVIRRPWPSMLRGVWGDTDRFMWTYWKDVPGSYLTGDGDPGRFQRAGAAQQRRGIALSHCTGRGVDPLKISDKKRGCVMVISNYDSESHILTFRFSDSMNTVNSKTDDSAIAAALEKAMENTAATAEALLKPLQVTFDLKDVDFVSSFFFRVCLSTAKRVRKGNFSIAHARPAVTQLLKIAGMDEFIAAM